MEARKMDFGTIDLNPNGDSISIKAQNGSARPENSHSVVFGGKSGEVVFASKDVKRVSIEYPPPGSTVSLTNGEGGIIILKDISLYSQYTNGEEINLPGGYQKTRISIGGTLVFSPKALRGLAGTGNKSTYRGTLRLKIISLD